MVLVDCKTQSNNICSVIALMAGDGDKMPYLVTGLVNNLGGNTFVQIDFPYHPFKIYNHFCKQNIFQYPLPIFKIITFQFLEAVYINNY